MPKRDDTAWESKRLNRVRDSQAGGSQFNGLVIPDSVSNDPFYQQLRSALPEPMRSLLDDFITSLLYPKRSQE